MLWARSLLLALALAGFLGSGCEQSAEDQRAAYCEELKDRATGISRTVEESGPSAFVKALPALEALAEESPGDLRDEWQLLLKALHRLEEAFEAADVDPAKVGAALPADLPEADRKRIEAAAAGLADPGVAEATQGIEQHARDVCKTPLL